MNKLVSIVLPVYNGEKYLQSSIDSVLNQTYSNLELIIMDDSSSDHTKDIALANVERDKRVSYYCNEHNLKLPNNLNRGFYLSKGDYLTWTSHDNLYKSEALEKMVNAIESSGCQFAFASCRVINEAGDEIEYMMVHQNSPKLIVGHDTVGACFLYTRALYETIGDYDDKCILVEDFDYWQRALSRFKAVPIEEILYYYRWHDGALTSTMNRSTFNFNLEKMLLKNRQLFGRLDIEQKFTYYHALSLCRSPYDNPYLKKDKLYSALYFILYRIPRKINRIIMERQ